MELKVDIPALAGQDIDPATFQRVWDRVMPDQTAPSPRNDAVPPVTIPDTSVPAEPSVPPEETPPSEPAPSLPPVPDCPALSPVPDCPALSPVPDCPPSCPECPTCPDCPACPEPPACPECPACPEPPACPECPPQKECPPCPDCPSQPVPCPPASGCTPCEPVSVCPPTLCLGQAALGDSQRLEMLMTLAKAGAQAGQCLARRSSGSCAKAMAALACDHRTAFRRLSAAYFLITGKRYAPQCSAPGLPSSLPLALRQQFGWEQQWNQQNCQAAQATTDPCLKELYLELAQEGAFHAGTIRSILEQMA